MHPEGNKVEPEGAIKSVLQLSQIASIQLSALPRRLNSSGVWLGLTAILLLATALRLVLRLGFSNRDSFNYVLAAMKLNEYGVVHYLSDLSNIYENRVSIVFPLALIFRLIGTTETATTLLPLIAALITIVLVFILGYLSSARAGIIAALIVATLPLMVGLSTSVLPDSLIPFYTGASLLCLWIGLRRDSFWLYVLSGVFLFFAFQSRATSGVLVIPLILIALCSGGRNLKAITTPTGTFILLLGAFWLILYMVAGDAPVQYKLLIHDGSMENFAGTGEFLGYFRDTVTRLNPDFGVLFHLAILALIFAAYRSRRSEKYRLPLISFTFLYLFFEFGSTSLTTYLPIWKLSRFLTILIVPVALLVALASDELLSNKRRAIRYIVFSLLSIQLLLGVIYVIMFGDFITKAVQVEKSTYERVIQKLGSYDGATVAVVDIRWSDWGTVYAAFQGDRFHFAQLNNVSRDTLSPETIVIFAPTYITAYGNVDIDRDHYPALAGLPAQTPESWELLFVEPLMEPPAQFEGDPVRVYRIARH